MTHRVATMSSRISTRQVPHLLRRGADLGVRARAELRPAGLVRVPLDEWLRQAALGRGRDFATIGIGLTDLSHSAKASCSATARSE